MRIFPITADRLWWLFKLLNKWVMMSKFEKIMLMANPSLQTY